jgi:cytosine/adenosine deaminase-related metal-dependent hydrolase
MDQPREPARLYRAAAVRDAAGVAARPGLVLVCGGEIVAAGSEQEVRRAHGPAARIIECPGLLLLPALVNSHAHLDLTLLGPRPFDGDFVAWLRAAAAARPRDPQVVAAAVQQGLRLSAQAGVGYVGDVARDPAAILARLRRAPGSPAGVSSGFSGGVDLSGTGIGGVSYLEAFGVGRRQKDGFIELLERVRCLPSDKTGYLPHAPIALGLQPHAPYSAGLGLYHAAGRFAAERDLRLCTHLAESPEELEFIARADGPLADMLRQLGKWDDTLVPTGQHPVDYLEPELRRGGWLAAHCNYAAADHIHLLAYTRTSVAYCPIASAYFGLPRAACGGPAAHRYRDMLDAGVNVCLGTDSILCQSPAEPQPLGILPQMRYLYHRDRTDPDLLLRMATVNGLQAMDLPESAATLGPGAPARLIGVPINADDPTDPLVQALAGRQPVQPICWSGPPAEPHAAALP